MSDLAKTRFEEDVLPGNRILMLVPFDSRKPRFTREQSPPDQGRKRVVVGYVVGEEAPAGTKGTRQWAEQVCETSAASRRPMTGLDVSLVESSEVVRA